MKLSTPIKNNIVTVIGYLYVLLFVYAAVSKLLDVETFQVQLGQSPLLSAFAGWVSWGVLLIELFTAGLLMFDKTRRNGLYIAFVLMAMFTAYIFIILNFSPFVPCSCGGVLEKMGWTEHLIFNISFLLLAVLGIFLSTEKKEGTGKTNKKTTIILSTALVLSVGFVTLLFVLSEDIIHKRNNFVRRFPPHPAKLENELDLKLNSYYIAGIDKDHIYLSNVTAQLYVKVLNKELETVEENEISLSKMDLPFRYTKVCVSSPEFYFLDGSIPVIFNGKVKDWKTNLNYAKAFFSLAVPMDSLTFAIRARDSKTNENIIGILKIGDSSAVELSRDLLVKQIDGVFDTDGTLLYNEQLKKIIYTYYYRNQFIVTDNNLKLDFIGKTIDTISQAQIKVSYVSSEKTNKMSAPPLIVNKSTATYGNYLFVHSGLMGQFEPKDTWKKSSVIDVYDLVKNTYAFSFYIPNRGKDRMSEFYVYGDRLVCIVGEYILTYKLDIDLFGSSITDNQILK